MSWNENIRSDILLALQFFTRLPISSDRFDTCEQSRKLGDAVVAFPIVGLIISLPLVIIWIVCSQFISPILSATITVFSGALLTGALHEDGLADCADGLGATIDKTRALEIMRDSTIGTYGAIALFATFSIRIFALSGLDMWQGALALLLTHSIARSAIVIAINSANYVRASGIGSQVSEGTSDSAFRASTAVSLAIAVIIAIISAQFSTLLAPVAAFLAAWLFLQWLVSRLGGYTGDGLGAIEQIAECVLLMMLSALWT